MEAGDGSQPNILLALVSSLASLEVLIPTLHGFLRTDLAYNPGIFSSIFLATRPSLQWLKMAQWHSNLPKCLQDIESLRLRR